MASRAVGLDAAEARAARRRGPCGTLLFAASMGMLDPPWLEEMEARLRATKPERDKARAERARERHHLARWPKGRDG